jgi:membrane associated rhomboid family serine protease
MRASCPVVTALIVVNALVYAVQVVLGPRINTELVERFGLGHAGLAEGALWQFLTHGFLHGNVWHLLFNMLSFWFAGRAVEGVLKGPRFLALYLISVLGGGILQIILGQPQSQLIGASGGVFGILVAYSTLFADRDVVVLLFFVLPIRLRARYLGQGLALLSLAALVTRFEPWIGHAAHLGGCVGGYLAARALGYGRPTFPERCLTRMAGRSG